MAEDGLTVEQIRMLAELERGMDAGKVPFVIYRDGRAAMDNECLTHFGLTQGQTVNDEIWRAIQEWNLERCQREIALRKNPN